MASRREEITIVGGGIAGLSLGIALRLREVPVRLLEASHYPRHRVCGEFISGVKPETLQKLGVEEILSDSESLVSTGWYDDRGSVLEARLPVPARGISRYRLDQRMAEKIVELGGVVEEGTRYRTESDDESGVVLSTGRPVKKGSEWMGLKAHYTALPLVQDLEMHLGKGGYLGMSGVENARVNVCGLFRRRSDLKVSRETALQEYVRAVGLNELADRLEKGGQDPESCVGVSAFTFGYQLEKESPYLRLGDRGAIIPPFTGNGMSMAFESAEMALDSLVRYSEGKVEWDTMQSAFDQALRKRFRRRLGVSRLFHPVMANRVGRTFIRGAMKTRCLPFEWLFQKTR